MYSPNFQSFLLLLSLDFQKIRMKLYRLLRLIAVEEYFL